MEREHITHEWIEGYQSFEAVLVCTNVLQPWNSDQTSRCFQTYGWTDSTMPGYDYQQFTHEATSVTVLYDGGLLAIDYAGIGVGKERLPEAYGDLFSTLHALSWKMAQVYHHPATLGALLDHMGTAIPAHLDFDLEPANLVEAAPLGNDVDTIVERGHALLRTTDHDPLADLALEGMQSLGAGVEQSRALSEQPSIRATTRPISLEDDADDGNLDDDLVVVQRHVPHQSPAVETRVVASNTPSSDHHGAKVVPLARHEAVKEHLATPSVSAPAVPTPSLHTGRSIEAMDPVPPSQPLRTESIQPTRSDRGAPMASAPYGVLRLGKNAFYFDTPESPQQYDMVEEFSQTQEFDEVIHVYPGQSGPRVRWDLLGEIDPAYPTLAERIANLLGFDEQDAALVASIMLGLRNAQGLRATVREVAVQCCAGFWDGPKLQALSITEKFDDWRQRKPAFVEQLDAIALRLAGLLLFEEGQAFLDVQPSQNPDGGSEECASFTVRELVHGGIANFYFVHLDPLDGPSTHRIGAALRALVVATEASRRTSTAPEAAAGVGGRKKEVEAFKHEVLAELDELFVGVASKIKSMG